MWSFLVASCRWSNLSDLWIARSLLCRCPWDRTLKTGSKVLLVLLHLVSNGNLRETDMRSVKLSCRWRCLEAKKEVLESTKFSYGCRTFAFCGESRFVVVNMDTPKIGRHRKHHFTSQQNRMCWNGASTTRWKHLFFFFCRYFSTQSTDFSAWTSPPRSSCPKGMMLVWWGYTPLKHHRDHLHDKFCLTHL